MFSYVDEKTWKVHTSFAYKFIIDGDHRMESAREIWQVKCPFKIICFLWLITKEALLTWNNLQKRIWKGPNMCSVAAETIAHLFLMCTFTTRIWKKCAAHVGLTLRLTDTVDMWNKVDTSRNTRQCAHIYSIITAVICWNVWSEINNRVFRQQKHSIFTYFYLKYIDIHS